MLPYLPELDFERTLTAYAYYLAFNASIYELPVDPKGCCFGVGNGATGENTASTENCLVSQSIHLKERCLSRITRCVLLHHLPCCLYNPTAKVRQS